MDRVTKILLGITISVVVILIVALIIFIVLATKKQKEKFEQEHIISNFDTRNFGPLKFNFEKLNKDANENELLMKSGYNVGVNPVKNQKDYDKAISDAILKTNNKLSLEQKKLNSVMLARMSDAIPNSNNCSNNIADSENKFIEAASEQYVSNDHKCSQNDIGIKYSDYLETINLDQRDLDGQKAWTESLGNNTGLPLMFNDTIDLAANVKTRGLYGYQFAGAPVVEGWPTETELGPNDLLGRDPVFNSAYRG